MKTYTIENAKELEKFKDDYGYHIEGNAEFEYSADFKGRLLVDGYLEAKAGESIKAGGYIKAGGFIKAGWSIEAGGYIEAGEYIKAGWSIKAGEYIKAEYGITAMLQIACKLSLKAGLRIFAGTCNWRDIADEEKTIICGKLEGGKIEYGILKETGIPEEKPQGKKVKIKLADNQIVEGTIID